MKRVIRTCPFCQKKSSVIMPEAEYTLWQKGIKIQEAMPEQSASVREILMTGICLNCQDSIFGTD